MAESDSTPASDVANVLVAQLEAEADFVEAGSFTLDASKAREKLAGYQLAEPERFVLLLVEAAHLLPNCTGVAFTIDNSSTKVVFHGAELPDDELHGCFDAMFIDVAGLDPEQARTIRGRQCLALALNTALGLSDGHVEMTSMSAGGGSVHAVFDRDGRVQTHEQPGPSLASALIVEVHPKLVLAQQHELLRRYARYATIPVHVNTIRVDVSPSADLLTPVDIRDAAGQVVGRLGWCAPQARRGSGGIAFVANGVIVEAENTQEHLPIGSLALVDADDLHRDLSQTKLQRDEAFRQRFEAVVAACETLSQPVPTLGPRPTDKEEAGNGRGLFACGLVVILTMFVNVWALEIELRACILALGLAIAYLGIWGIRRAGRRGDVRANGHAGFGTISSASRPGIGLHETRPIRISMRIERAGHDDYNATFKTFVGSDHELVQADKRMYVRIDPKDPSFVVFDAG
jgi:hypothetical protein